MRMVGIVEICLGIICLLIAIAVSKMGFVVCSSSSARGQAQERSHFPPAFDNSDLSTISVKTDIFLKILVQEYSSNFC